MRARCRGPHLDPHPPSLAHASDASFGGQAHPHLPSLARAWRALRWAGPSAPIRTYPHPPAPTAPTAPTRTTRTAPPHPPAPMRPSAPCRPAPRARGRSPSFGLVSAWAQLALVRAAHTAPRPCLRSGVGPRVGHTPTGAPAAPPRSCDLARLHERRWAGPSGTHLRSRSPRTRASAGKPTRTHPHPPAQRNRGNRAWAARTSSSVKAAAMAGSAASMAATSVSEWPSERRRVVSRKIWLLAASP